MLFCVETKHEEPKRQMDDGILRDRRNHQHKRLVDLFRSQRKPCFW